MANDIQASFSIQVQQRFLSVSQNNIEIIEHRYLTSDEFNLCGYKWLVAVYPLGIDEISDSMAVKLVNLSNSEIYASYSLSVKNQGNQLIVLIKYFLINFHLSGWP